MSSSFFLDALSAVSGADFEEKPVDIETFVTSEDFCDLDGLSTHQYSMVKAMSQIYKEETLVALYGEKRGREIFAQTCNEIIMQLGKGSGKDFTSTVGCAYLVYLLLCLKDPARYFGKPKNDTIDILNIAINSEQAKNVFFKNFVTRIKDNPWFDGRYSVKSNSIEFDKNINVYSGHSEREAFEGLNVIMVILDEISGFALDSNTGNDRADTADATYQMYRASVDSRFPDYGKVALLSFPRFANDYIQQRYDAAVAEKEIIMRSHTFKIDQNLPDGTDGNEFEIEWEEDHVKRYTFPRLFALRRPTWEVNPGRKIEDYTRAFMTNPADALGRFACMPSDNAEDAFFKDKESIEQALVGKNGVDNDGNFFLGWQPKEGVEYYMHVDLSKVHDRCSVAVAHVDKWVNVQIDSAGYKETHPYVVVDAIRWWKPSKLEPMDFKDVEKFIVDVYKKGFKIKLVTFDRWQSLDVMNNLNNQNIKTELLSVANKHYDDFLSVMYDRRLKAPAIEEFKDELRQLKWIKGKIDHPRAGYKDISDSVAGAIYNAVSYTKEPQHGEIEVVTLADLYKQQSEDKYRLKEKTVGDHGEQIRPPRDMPESIWNYLNAGKVI